MIRVTGINPWVMFFRVGLSLSRILHIAGGQSYHTGLIAQDRWTSSQTRGTVESVSKETRPDSEEKKEVTVL